MIHTVDEQLRAEIVAFRLQFTCEECVAFDAPKETCAYGFPVEPHRRRELSRARSLVFCKTFELA